jgi:hypothetical protein
MKNQRTSEENPKKIKKIPNQKEKKRKNQQQSQPKLPCPRAGRIPARPRGANRIRRGFAGTINTSGK